MASYKQVEKLMDAAVEAIGNGDYPTAENKAVAAMGTLAVIPIDLRKDGHASGSMRYSESMINEFIANVQKLASRKARRKSNGLGLQSVRVRFGSGRCGQNDPNPF